ncbi:MAG: DAK2 domain-containing protein [Clostridia bacterium]|nr:DAK2 domain-containing protein [Clostridia bacterium]
MSEKKADKASQKTSNASTKETSKKSNTKSNAQAKKKPQEKKKGGFLNIKYLGGLLFAKMVRGGTSELRSNAEEVNKLNVFPVPDGDTGDNMRMTIESGIAAIENLDTDDLADVMKLFSHGMLLGARGNSGVILSQFFAGMAKELASETRADPAAFARALEMGVEQAYMSVMTPTEGTILTVAREAVEYAVASLTPQSTIRSLFADLVKEMHESLNRTPEVLGVLKEAGVVDSGGAGLFYIMDGFNRVLNGEEIADVEMPASATKPPVTPTTSFGPDSVLTYGYCTEFLLQLQNFKTDIEAFDIEALKAYLSRVGDSIVAFKTDSIVKVHVHTKCPERVLAVAHRYGEFLTVKIENMSVQHTELSKEETKAEESAKEEPIEETVCKPYGVVAVSNGEGFTDLFREFGADEIVEGGQTNNPSTGEFLAAYDKILAKHIFVLPNNGNIMMAAEQSAALYEKAHIHVIPAKNIGAGYVALSSADLTAEHAEDIVRTMTEAIGRVRTGYVSPAVRDADMNGVHVTNGDTIGILDKEIVVSCRDCGEATKALLDRMLRDSDYSMLTVFKGKDAMQATCDELAAYVEQTYPALEVYFAEGGQEIAPYFLLAE